MTISAQKLTRAIHDSPHRVVLAISGGGSRAISDLLLVPGGSRTLLAAEVPYCEQAMITLLGCRPEQFCSGETARAMAMAAWRRAIELDGNEQEVAGVACTAGLATDRQRQGADRAHIAIQDLACTRCWSVELKKDARTRAEEENLVAGMLLNAVAAACKIEDRVAVSLLPGEQVEEICTAALPAWADLVAGKIDRIAPGASPPPSTAVFPGAFHPLHSGHRRIAEIGTQMLQTPVSFEISVENVDKPLLDYHEIAMRLEQFSADAPVWLTRAATFEQKTQLFPGATFLIGTDTLQRIADPRYYGGNAAACQAAIQRIADRDCRFLVFSRNMGSGLARLSDLDLPPILARLCREVPADVFREDVSSTSLRKSSES